MAVWSRAIRVKQITKNEWQDVRWLLNHLRQTDNMELSLTETDVEKDLFNDEFCNYIAYLGDRPLFIGGISRKTYTGYGHMIWAVCRYDTYDKYKREWVRVSNALMANWKHQYGQLWNMILERNDVSKRWLKRMGATFSEPFIYNGVNWQLFRIEVNHNVQSGMDDRITSNTRVKPIQSNQTAV